MSLLHCQSAAALSVTRVSRPCPDACGEIFISGEEYKLTLGDHLAKHRHGLQSGAVPSTVAKLELTLVYSQLGSPTHRIHHLHTALTDLNLERKHTGTTSATNTVPITLRKHYLIHRIDAEIFHRTGINFEFLAAWKKLEDRQSH